MSSKREYVEATKEDNGWSFYAVYYSLTFHGYGYATKAKALAAGRAKLKAHKRAFI